MAMTLGDAWGRPARVTLRSAVEGGRSGVWILVNIGKIQYEDAVTRASTVRWAVRTATLAAAVAYRCRQATFFLSSLRFLAISSATDWGTWR